ncbi:MAG: hypothetical protein JRI82_11930 [Deltaproteobacteria bacterium]|nr:hypothetical protein [Deltaproteobacteria bacterium]
MPRKISNIIFDGGAFFRLGLDATRPNLIDFTANPVDVKPKPLCNVCEYVLHLPAQLWLRTSLFQHQERIGQLVNVIHDPFPQLVDLHLQNKAVFRARALYSSLISFPGRNHVINVRQQFIDTLADHFGGQFAYIFVKAAGRI